MAPEEEHLAAAIAKVENRILPREPSSFLWGMLATECSLNYNEIAALQNSVISSSASPAGTYISWFVNSFAITKVCTIYR